MFSNSWLIWVPLEERQEKDFMIIRLNRNSITQIVCRTLSLVFLLACSCGRELSDDPIPVIFFPNAVINLSFPEFQQSLAVDGGFKVISTVAGNSVGVRGVIIYRKDAANYLAFEVNCSFHPNEASSNVNVNASRLYMTCSGCGSDFSFTGGTPTGGVAWRTLRR